MKKEDNISIANDLRRRLNVLGFAMAGLRDTDADMLTDYLHNDIMVLVDKIGEE